MKMSKLFVQTLREFPGDAEAISHKMLVRAGYIKKLANGIYSYLPLMKRVISKVEQIAREELDKAGAQELSMPFVQPAELWQKSGRWQVYGKELLRMKDRHDVELCLGPTHEEVITSIADGILTSYKQLPVNLYQFQLKFRDEIRPRFGLLRGREFIMKDGYSFHTSQESLDEEYKNMWDAYKRIFERCGLETKPVQSDSGAIGGKISHEFMVLTETQTGEDDVFYCKSCDYSANSNHAHSILNAIETTTNYTKEEIVDTPNTKTIKDVAEFLGVNENNILKSVMYIVDSKPVMVMIRGDKEVEETKLLNAVCGLEIRKATEEEVKEFTGSEAGYLSFVGLEDKIKVLFDNSAKYMKNFVIGANEVEKHIVGYNFKKEYESLNGTSAHKVEIIKDNNIVYIDMKKASELLESGSGVIYFGAASCEECRASVPVLLDAMSSSELETIYYVDLTNENNLRDEYVLNEKNKAKVKLSATAEYDSVRLSLANHLEDYVLTTTKGKKVNTGQKRLQDFLSKNNLDPNDVLN